MRRHVWPAAEVLMRHCRPRSCRTFHSCQPAEFIASSLLVLARASGQSTGSTAPALGIQEACARTSRSCLRMVSASGPRYTTIAAPRQIQTASLATTWAEAPETTEEIPPTPTPSLNGASEGPTIKPLSATRAPHKQTGAPWTRNEDDLLFSLRQRGIPWKQISLTIKRPVGSCYSRYHRFLDPFLADAIEDDYEEEEAMKSAVEAAQRALEANVNLGTLALSKEKSGKPLPYIVQGPWTAKDRERLESMIKSSTAWSTIARELQRNQESCKEKWLRIQKSRREKKRHSSRIRGDQWTRLYKEGFTPHHRDQLMRAVEKQLGVKLNSAAHNKDPLRLLDANDRRGDDGSFGLMMMHQTQDSADRWSGNDGIFSGATDRGEIDWDAIAEALNNKFPAARLKAVYRELAAAKLIWTPEEDDRLTGAVVRLGPPEFQPKIWTMIKHAFGDVIRTSEDYRARWRELDMPQLEREWDDSEKAKFWQRWAEFRKGTSLFSTSNLNTNSTSRPDDNSTESAPGLTNPTDACINEERMWDAIAEGLEYRHGRDCQLYFERTTAPFPKDPELFQYLTQQVANVYLEPRKTNWSPEASRMLVATVNSFLQANKVVIWDSVAKTLGNRFTTEQCKNRWTYWSQNHGQALEESAVKDSDESTILEDPETSSKNTSTAIAPAVSSTRLWTDQELKLLQQAVQERGHQWAAIRDAFLSHRTVQMLHERHWRDQPKRTGRFTEKERTMLEAAIETFGENAGWALIASQVPGRTASQCRNNWNYSQTHHVQKIGEPWTHDDKEQLRKAVDRFGTKRWTLVSTFVVGKTPHQCRNEWRDKLNPSVNNSPWSGKELDRLMERVETIMSRKEEKERIKVAAAAALIADGKLEAARVYTEKALDLAPRFKGKMRVNWNEVAKGMAGRTPQQCRVRFAVHRKLYRIQGNY